MKIRVVGDGRLEVRERPADKHHMLVARVRFAPGDVVHPIRVRGYIPHPTRHSVQTGESEHALLAPQFLQYVNHSCEPNVVFDTQARLVRAVRAIEPGEEIVFFYPSTEWCMESPFDCLCGSTQCVGRITGASTLDPGLLPRYQFALHIDRLLSRSDLATRSMA